VNCESGYNENMNADNPTAYSDVNAMLLKLLSEAQRILKDQFIGMYLYGSLASGDFNPETSDIDFLVVTSEALSKETISELEKMHVRFWQSGMKWASKLEGRYIAKDEMCRHNPNYPARPCLNEGEFYMAREESDWIIQRYTIRLQGITLAGPDPKTLIDPVAPIEIQKAISGYLCEWWKPLLDHPARLDSSKYQAYAILSMCRALYTLEYDTIASKQVSARWTQENFGRRWSGLIAEALAWRPDVVLDRKNETIDFIRFTIEEYQL